MYYFFYFFLSDFSYHNTLSNILILLIHSLISLNKNILYFSLYLQNEILQSPKRKCEFFIFNLFNNNRIYYFFFRINEALTLLLIEKDLFVRLSFYRIIFRFFFFFVFMIHFTFMLLINFNYK